MKFEKFKLNMEDIFPSVSVTGSPSVYISGFGLLSSRFYHLWLRVRFPELNEFVFFHPCAHCVNLKTDGFFFCP